MHTVGPEKQKKRKKRPTSIMTKSPGKTQDTVRNSEKCEK